MKHSSSWDYIKALQALSDSADADRGALVGRAVEHNETTIINPPQIRIFQPGTAESDVRTGVGFTETTLMVRRK